MLELANNTYDERYMTIEDLEYGDIFIFIPLGDNKEHIFIKKKYNGTTCCIQLDGNDFTLYPTSGRRIIRKLKEGELLCVTK